jgi:cytochrome P450
VQRHRLVNQPMTLHGKDLREGDRVFIMLNSANRDPRAYPDPDRLDIQRDGVPHLTFGYGIHLCLGFALARVEGKVAFPKLLQAFREIEPATPSQEWINSLVFRGMRSFPVRVRYA